jgi:hypothetical protein
VAATDVHEQKMHVCNFLPCPKLWTAAVLLLLPCWFSCKQALDAARKASESAARRLAQISSEIGDDRPIQVRSFKTAEHVRHMSSVLLLSDPSPLIMIFCVLSSVA